MATLGSDVALIAISTDDPKTLASWASEEELPFVLASDAGGSAGSVPGAGRERVRGSRRGGREDGRVRGERELRRNPIASISPRQTLIDLYRAAVAGALPASATRAAVAGLDVAPTRPVWIIAIGKAGLAMAAGAVEALASAGREPAGGVIVAPHEEESPSSRLDVVVGDHPIPGPQSAAAAAAIGKVASAVTAGDQVLVLVSGGGTSLAAAPATDIEHFSQTDLAQLYAALLESGADIVAMNAVRKRFARWAGGRLAVALQRASVQCLVVSDVLGDDIGSISSGPCVGDPLTAAQLVSTLRTNGLWGRLPDAARRHLEAGTASETPKPRDPAFAHVVPQVVVSNAHALSAAAERARALAVGEVVVEPTPLSGEASIAGVRLASDLIARRKRARGPWVPRCVIWGGETTVTFATTGARTTDRLGGRNQELALAAARSLSDAGDAARGITLLAAGTDGRDGPTDAAGAIVDGLTWPAIQFAGRDPAIDLAGHNAYRALDAAGALLRTGPSGTNVMDVVIGLVER